MGPKRKLPEPEDTCFVIMPIREEGTDEWEKFKGVYDDIIAPAVSEADIGLTPLRADEIEKPGSITEDIIRYCVKSKVVIADLTDKNPNVLYELGVRHARSNRTILMASKKEELPFDTSTLRTILYKMNNSSNWQSASAKIVKFLHGALEENAEQDSPVLRLYSVSNELQVKDHESAQPLNHVAKNDKQKLLKNIKTEVLLKGYHRYTNISDWPADWMYFSDVEGTTQARVYASHVIGVSPVDSASIDYDDFLNDAISLVGFVKSRIVQSKLLVVMPLLSISSDDCENMESKLLADLGKYFNSSREGSILKVHRQLVNSQSELATEVCEVRAWCCNESFRPSELGDKDETR